MSSPTSREVWAYRPAPSHSSQTPPLLMPVTLGEAVNAGAFGGTATVHRILTKPYHFMAAKVFHETGLAHRQTAEAYAKLQFIAANSEGLRRGFVRAGRVTPGLSFVAWPEALLYSANTAKPEKLIGFAMPLFGNTHPLSHLTSPKQRKIHFAGLEARHLLVAAKNIAGAVQALHGADGKSGILIGDLTPRNILIDANLRCQLIDADSYQFTTSAKVYATADTTPGFRSPRMATAARANKALPPVSADDDAFCLAVVLFHVLVDGAHPWTAGERFELNGVKPDEEDNMLAGRFPYADPATCFPPKIRLQTYQKLPAAIRQLFEAAFLTAKRPSPQQWIDALGSAHAGMSTSRHAITTTRPQAGAAAAP